MAYFDRKCALSEFFQTLSSNVSEDLRPRLPLESIYFPIFQTYLVRKKNKDMGWSKKVRLNNYG